MKRHKIQSEETHRPTITLTNQSTADVLTDTYSNELRRVYSSHSRQYLDRSPLLQYRKKHAHTKELHLHVLGMALIAPGKLCCGVTTDWDAQEALLWSVFDFADDTFTCNIIESVGSSMPRRLAAYMLASGAQPGEQSLCQLAPWVGHAVLSDLFCRAGFDAAMSGYEVAAAWGCQEPLLCRCVFVPLQLTHAILEEQFWNRLMFSARAMRKN